MIGPGSRACKASLTPLVVPAGALAVLEPAEDGDVADEGGAAAMPGLSEGDSAADCVRSSAQPQAMAVVITMAVNGGSTDRIRLPAMATSRGHLDCRRDSIADS